MPLATLPLKQNGGQHCYAEDCDQWNGRATVKTKRFKHLGEPVTVIINHVVT